MAVDAATAATRWEQAAAGGAQKWSDAIQSTSADQAGNAIRQKNVMAANFAQSVASGHWERRVAASGGTANWKAQSVKKAGNYATGVAAGKDKYQSAMQTWLPIIEQAASAARAIPKTSIAASKQRVAVMIDTLHAAKLSR